MKAVYLGLACLLVLMVCISIPASADSFTDEEGVEWLEVDNYTLYWGQEVNTSGYVIKAADFSPSYAFDTDSDYVMLTVTSNRSETWQTVLARNNSNIPDNYIFDGRLNVTALSVVTGNNIPVPFTNISVYLANLTEAQNTVVDRIDLTISVEENRAKEAYMDERAYFEIKVKNLMVVPVSIQVIQTIPDGLVFDPDVDVEWNTTLAAGGLKSYQYSLKALRPGTYNFTGTKVLVPINGRVYSKVLNDTQFVVHGPYINLSKANPDNSGESVQVGDILRMQVIAVNEGDRAAYVSVSDELPAGGVLVEGATSSSKILYPSESITFTYSIKVGKAGNIVIPSAAASYTDPRDYEDVVYSRRYIMHVSDYGEQAGYEQADSGDDLYQDIPDFSEVTEQPETVEEDHGIFQIFYDLMDAIGQFVSRLRQK